MPWTENGEYVYDGTSDTDNTGNADYYTPGINPGRDDVVGGDEYTYDSLGNLYKNGTLFRAVQQPGDDAYTPGLPSVVPGIGDTSGISGILKKLFVNKDGTLDLRALGAVGGGLAGLLGANKSTTTPSGYQGKIPQYTAVRNMATAPQAGKRPGAGGTRYGGDVSYMPKGSSPLGGGLASLIGRGLESGATQPVDANGNPGPEYVIDPSLYAFYGGENGRSVSPSNMMKSINTPGGAPRAIDTPEVMRTINPNERADAYASGGLAGRYLQGETDGMADEIPAKIGKDQPAALSHGEFVIPADVVSHLGNGNSDAGAQKLYGMMDKIREARTGTKKQGKEINPDKFMPGGAVSRYAEGGITGAGAAANAGVTGTESNLSNWAGDYVTDMLGKGKALSEMPYQEYGGPLTAGASDLQNRAFSTAGNLSVPGSIGAAAQTAGDIANKAQGINYAPTTFDNQFKAPVTSDATNFTNQYQAPTPYSNTTFSSGTFGRDQAQQYMNPYLQQSLNPQLEEARRQSDITEQANKAAMTRAGAYGGGRSAILAAENQRNLGTNLANITGKGYDTAYTNAMSQYNQDQARNMQAQQASEQSKQFGATQGMTAADLMAKYGMSAQQAQEAARQFQQNQAMTGAQSSAQYGQAAKTAEEQSKQFGADFGLKGLNTALQAANTQGNLGISSADLGLRNLKTQADMGATQRGIESEGIAADKAAFEEARANPYKMVQYQQSLLSGLPLAAQNINTAQPSTFQQMLAGAGGVAGMFGNKTSLTQDDVSAALAKLGIKI
jgi:hypothetical protein